MGRIALHRISVLLVLLLASLSLTSLLLAPRAAHASDDATAQARSLYVQGVKEQKAGRLVQAQAAFAKAFALKKHYQIAGNLGSVELDLKLYRDAAEHLSWALADIQRESKAATEDVNTIAERLRVAQAKVVTLRLTVRLLDRPHAAFRLQLDGKAIGSSAGLAFMPPGRHRLQAQTDGAVSLTQNINGQAGASMDVTLRLRPSGGGLIVARAAKPKERAADRPAWPLWGQVAIGGVGLVTTVTFWVLHASHASKADDLARQVEAEGGQAPHDVCDVADGALFDRCNDWRDQRANATDTGALAVASSITLAGSAAFALAYALAPPRLFGRAEASPTKSGEQARQQRRRRTVLVPMISGQQAGLRLVGSF